MPGTLSVVDILAWSNVNSTQEFDGIGAPKTANDEVVIEQKMRKLGF